MDPGRIEGTLWNILYYITGAVNRFLRSEPPDTVSNDPLQESTRESSSGGDALTSDNGTKLDTLEDQLKPEGPESQNCKEDNCPTAKVVEKEDSSIDLQPQTAKNYTSSTTVGLKHDIEMPLKARYFDDELITSKSQKGFMEEWATAVPVHSEGEKRQGRSMTLSVCDDPVMPQALSTPTCEESQKLLSDENKEFEQNAKTTQGLLEVGDSKEIPNLPEEVENNEEESLQKGRSKVETKYETSARLVLPSSMKMVLDAHYGLAADNDMKDHQDGIKVVELEQGQGLSVATGDNETRRGRTKESARLGHEKPLDVDVERGQLMEDLAGSELVEDTRLNVERDYKLHKEDTKLEIDNNLNKKPTVDEMTASCTEETISQHQNGITEDLLDFWAQAALSEDSKQDQISKGKPGEVKFILEKQVSCQTESFTELSLSSLNAESGFSDLSFGDLACTGDPTNPPFAAEQDYAQDLLDMNAKESHQLQSEMHISDSEASLEQLSRYSEPFKAKFMECEDQVQVSNIINFAPQKSRIAVKNPRVRPPKNPRSLLRRPSVDPVLAPPPATEISVGVQALEGLGFGLKLSGLGVSFPALTKLPKKEAELKPEKGDTPTQELPQQPKWLPPRQSGRFGNPFMSELKTKLKKSNQK